MAKSSKFIVTELIRNKRKALSSGLVIVFSPLARAARGSFEFLLVYLMGWSVMVTSRNVLNFS